MPVRPRLRLLALATVVCLPAGATSLYAQERYLQPPATMDANQRCTYFSRLRRFTVISKSDCDDGRQVKPGPITTQILSQCQALQGVAYDSTPIQDLVDGFALQVQQQGLGDACHAIKAEVWDLIAQ